jgi:hypothetical protein
MLLVKNTNNGCGDGGARQVREIQESRFQIQDNSRVENIS